jgi:hypothetical protein
MKHVVELKYTNPSHEHVSLRRRVETVNRVVEAQSADEALNRAANQQRSLGFRIQSANIVEQKIEESTSALISEETELEEGKIAKALAVGAMALASMGAKAHTDTTKSVAQLAQERPALAQRLHDIGASGQVPASDKRAAELQRKQDQEMPASERRAKELKKEEVELEEGKYASTIAAIAAQAYEPKVGDKVRTRKGGQIPGKVEKIENNKVFFRHPEGKLYATHSSNLMREEAEQVDEGSKRMSAAVKLQRAFDKEKTASDASRKRGEEMLDQARAEYAKKQAAKTNEEVEQVDEANMRFDPEAAARPKSSDVKNFLNRDKNARAGAASKKYIRRMTKLGGLGPNQTKKDTEKHMKDYFEEVEISEASKEGKSVMYGMRASMKAMDLRHGVDSDKRDSGYKMSPAVRAAQAKSDALSKVEKPVQAGTLAALKRREMKKEAVDPGSMKVVNKKVKAADKMIKAAKGKVNKIDLKPTLDLDSYKD